MCLVVCGNEMGIGFRVWGLLSESITYQQYVKKVSLVLGLSFLVFGFNYLYLNLNPLPLTIRARKL